MPQIVPRSTPAQALPLRGALIAGRLTYAVELPCGLYEKKYFDSRSRVTSQDPF